MKQETPEGIATPEEFEERYILGASSSGLRHKQMLRYAEYYHQERLKQSLPSKEEIDTVAWQKFGGQGGSQNTYREIFRSGIRKGIELLTKGKWE